MNFFPHAVNHNGSAHPILKRVLSPELADHFCDLVDAGGRQRRRSALEKVDEFLAAHVEDLLLLDPVVRERRPRDDSGLHPGRSSEPFGQPVVDLAGSADQAPYVATVDLRNIDFVSRRVGNYIFNPLTSGEPYRV